MAVLEFQYIGRVLTELDDNWPAVVANWRKAHRGWECISRILGREGEYPQIYGNFNTAVVQATFLFGAATWFMTHRIGITLGIFYHRVVRQLVGIRKRQDTEGGWVYQPLDTEITAVGL